MLAYHDQKKSLDHEAAYEEKERHPHVEVLRDDRDFWKRDPRQVECSWSVKGVVIERDQQGRDEPDEVQSLEPGGGRVQCGPIGVSRVQDDTFRVRPRPSFVFTLSLQRCWSVTSAATADS